MIKPIAPFTLVGTTQCSHYWKDANGRIFDSVSPNADKDPLGRHGMSYFVETEKEFDEERQLAWRYTDQSGRSRYSTYVPAKERLNG